MAKKSKSRKNEIDLHGIKHQEIEQILINKIESLWNTNTTLSIITGNSGMMKSIVTKILEEYNLVYYVSYFNDGVLCVDI